MPRNGSGNYTLPPIYQATPGTTIRSDQHNVPLRDVEQALTDSLPRDGSAPMTGNLPMGGRRITGLGAPTDANDAARKAYVDGAKTTPARIDMTDAGLIGRAGSGVGPAARVAIGDGLGFNAGALAVRLGEGLSFAAGLVTAAVKVFSTQAQAEAGADNNTAMTPLGVSQYVATQAVGIGQSWANLTGNRSEGTSYRNTTGRPIMVNVTMDGVPSDLQVSTNNSNWVNVGRFGESGRVEMTVSIIVPAGHYYRTTGGGSILFWAELR